MLNFSKVKKIAKWQVTNNKTNTWLFIFLELAQYGTEKQQQRCCTGPHAALDFCKCLPNCTQCFSVNIIYTMNNKKY